MITAMGICKSYRKKLILSDINLEIKSGKSAVIVGKNGAGKSTLLSILAGYLKPDAGHVETHGKKVAFCPHGDDLFEDLTVRDNLAFWKNARGADLNADILNLAKLLEVDTYEHKRVRHLSAGMKKSVALICALTGNPAVLILDEPFTALDIFYKSALLQTLEELLKLGICIIYTSHSADEIMGVNSDIYALSGGGLRYVGLRDDLLDIDGNIMTHLLEKL